LWKRFQIRDELAGGARLTVTLSEVARRAGVSQATASRVLNGRRYVSARSRASVESAARALDYVPHHAARELSMARTTTVALLVHHEQYPVGGEGTFSSRVIHGAMRALHAAGQDLLYVVVDDEEAIRLSTLPAVHPGRSDGALVLGPAFPRESMARLHAIGRPLVLIDNRVPSIGVDSVIADNRPAVEQLTTHLIADHGYRRIVCLAGPRTWPSTAERAHGYAAAMHAHGLEARVLHATEATIRDGAALATRLLDDPPDAIVAVNDAMAVGALHRFRAAAARPAVVGFDDISWARLTDPPLTTVAVDAGAMGALAANLLLARITQPDLPESPRVHRIPAVVRIRASCGCASTATEVP
jgi:DNA-binding LacI/PurR family transcriptional regulator